LVQKLNHWYGFSGLLLLLFAVFYPMVSLEWLADLLEQIDQSILEGDSGQLISTAFSYITCYLVLFVMIYLSAMLIADYITSSKSSIWFQLLFVLIVLLTIFIYKYFYQLEFGWINHFFILGILLLLKNFIPYQKSFYLSFVVILSLLLLSFLWLNVIPGLTKFGFGVDDLSLSLKTADAYLTEYKLFSTVGVTFSTAFFVITVILTILIYIFTQQILTLRKMNEKEEELKKTRGELVETKIFQEVTSLVHDLKTPLVSVEGLISLMRMTTDPNSKQYTYFKKMESSIEKMKDMISEILYHKVKTIIPVHEMIQYATSFIIFDRNDINFSVSCPTDLPHIKVNKIRFARALTNIIENAVASLEGRGGRIVLTVFQKQDWVYFQVKDNGPGIEKELYENIWQEGFSTKSSSGIGLSFVKRVIENHQGFVNVKSEPWMETVVELVLPAWEGEKENDFSH